MQHLQNQRSFQQINSWQSHERWNIILEAIQMEEDQRSSYVMDSLRDLQNNILKNGVILSSKQKLTSDELQNQKSKCCLINKLAISGPQKEEQARSTLENRTQYFINSYQQNADDFNKGVSQNNNRRIHDKDNKFRKQHRNIIKRTQDNTAQIVNQAKQLKNLIINERKKTNQGIDSLRKIICDETCKIQACIIQMRSLRLENQRKIDNMIQDLDLLLSGTVDQQFKTGEVTYECLLKLFEDTCSKMQNKLIK